MRGLISIQIVPKYSLSNEEFGEMLSYIQITLQAEGPIIFSEFNKTSIFFDNPICCSLFFPCGETDIMILILNFSNFANTFNKYKKNSNSASLFSKSGAYHSSHR